MSDLGSPEHGESSETIVSPAKFAQFLEKTLTEHGSFPDIDEKNVASGVTNLAELSLSISRERDSATDITINKIFDPTATERTAYEVNQGNKLYRIDKDTGKAIVYTLKDDGVEPDEIYDLTKLQKTISIALENGTQLKDSNKSKSVVTSRESKPVLSRRRFLQGVGATAGLGAAAIVLEKTRAAEKILASLREKIEQEQRRKDFDDFCKIVNADTNLQNLYPVHFEEISDRMLADVFEKRVGESDPESATQTTNYRLSLPQESGRSEFVGNTFDPAIEVSVTTHSDANKETTSVAAHFKNTSSGLELVNKDMARRERTILLREQEPDGYNRLTFEQLKDNAAMLIKDPSFASDQDWGSQGINEGTPTQKASVIIAMHDVLSVSPEGKVHKNAFMDDTGEFEFSTTKEAA